MKYNKLVRDKIPEYIRSKGNVPISHIAGEEEYWKKLEEKLQEEVDEFLRDGKLEEIADILEVIDAICDYQKFDKQELASIKNKKATERGKFEKRIILEEA